MKKIVYVVGWCLLFYAAGYYRAESVLAAVLAVGILGVLLFCLVLYQAAFLQAELSMEKTSCQKGELISGTVFLVNRSILPVSRFCIRLEYAHEPYGTKKVQKLEGLLAGRGRAELSFSITPMYCGCVSMELVSVRVWDLLGIFSKKKRVRAKKRAVILPHGSCMKIRGEQVQRDVWAGREMEEKKQAGHVPPDVAQIHPYQPGESLRAVHWKLTARLDDMMSRQYSEETAPLPIFYVQRGKKKEMDIGRMDAYWEVAAACSKGLLAAGIPHAVVWNGEKEQFYRREIHGETDLLPALREIMVYGRETEEERQRWLWGRLVKEYGSVVPVIGLDQSLTVYRDGKPITQFSWSGYRQELEKRWVSV